MTVEIDRHLEIYKHVDFKGDRLDNKSDECPWIGEDKNDKVSSIIVREGQWVFYQHKNYAGATWVLGPGQYANWKEGGFKNDMISSYRRNWYWVDPQFEHAWDDLDARRERVEARLSEALTLAHQAEAVAPTEELARLKRAGDDAARELEALKAKLAAEQARGEALTARRSRVADVLDQRAKHVSAERRLLEEARTSRLRETSLLEAADLVLGQEDASRIAVETALHEQVRAREAALAAVHAAEREVDAKTKELKEFTEAAARQLAADVDRARVAARAARERAITALEAALQGDEAAALAAVQAAADAAGEQALATLRREAAQARAKAVKQVEQREAEARETAVNELSARLAAPRDSDPFAQRLREGAPLHELVHRVPTVLGRAAEESDGRRVRVALAVVRDQAGETAPGIRVRLVDEKDRRIDEATTDAKGVALLRFPQKHRTDGATLGVLLVPQDNGRATRVAFKIPAATPPAVSQHAVIEVVVDPLPQRRGRAGDAFERMPADVTPALFDDLARLCSPRSDPFAGGPGEAPPRAPIVRRMTVPRVGAPRDGLPARRYLVTLRQEWVFIGYTFGELADVKGLVPGDALREATTTVQRTVESVQQEVAEAARKALQQAEEAMSKVSDASTLVQTALNTVSETNATTTTETEALTIQAGLNLGIVSFNAAYAKARTSVNSSVKQALNSSSMSNTTSHASQQASSMMRSAQSEVNSAVKRAVATSKSLESTLQRTLDRVTPLLSRATNMMQWTVYENYLVCSRVEDVKEIFAERVTSVSHAPGQLFSAADVSEYIGLFARDFRDPSLLVHVESLRAGLAAGKNVAAHPLVLHVNRHRTHYFGMLLNAAIDDVALRDDAPQLRRLGSHHPLWSLPLLGFEGDRAILVRDPRYADADAKKLLQDPGTATLVQVASPGAFSEAIQGLRELADLKGLVPPQLQRAVQVVPGDFKVLDLAKPVAEESPGGDAPAAAPLKDAPVKVPDAPAAPEVPVAPPA